MNNQTGTTERIPPQSLEAEQAVLGAMLLSREAIDAVIDQGLSYDSFYSMAHRKICKAIFDLYEKSQPADILTISHELTTRNQLEDIGGRAYLAGLTEAAPSIANADSYAKIVMDKAALGQIIETAAIMQSMSYDPTVDVEELIEISEQRIFAVKEHQLKQAATPIGEHIQDALTHIANGDKGLITGISSGFGPLDQLTTGFQNEDVIIIAARPSVGKTSLAMNIIDVVSVDYKIPSLIFSLEMSKEQLAIRQLCGRARVSSNRLKNNRRLSDDEWRRLSEAAGKISEAPIFLDDTPALNALEMRAKARRMKSREKIGLIVIDYAQLIKPPNNMPTREQEVSFNSRSIKAMARELKVPVILLAQLNRQVELRGKDAKPQLSDLRESGALEADADLVIFIHRPRDENGHWGIEGQFILAKQRNGPTGDIDIVFIKEFARFELAEKYYAQQQEFKDVYRG